jgi:hypothetical protein
LDRKEIKIGGGAEIRKKCLAKCDRKKARSTTPARQKKAENKVVTIGLLTPFLSGDFSLMTPS